MIDELRHFLAILEEGTLTKAAQKVGLSQPAMSASVNRLETWAGATLLVRGRRGATPNAAGVALAPWARRTLMSFSEGRAAVKRLTQLEQGEVRIAAGPTVCTYLLPSIIASFRSEHANIRFRVTEMATHSAREHLDSSQVDLALVFGEDEAPLFVDEMILVAAANYPLHGRVEALPFVAFRRGTSSRQLLERALPGVDVVTELGGISAIKANVRAGVGIALISRIAARVDLERGTLVEVPSSLTPVCRTLTILSLPDAHLSPAATAVKQFVRDHPEVFA